MHTMQHRMLNIKAENNSMCKTRINGIKLIKNDRIRQDKTTVGESKCKKMCLSSDVF